MTRHGPSRARAGFGAALAVAASQACSFDRAKPWEAPEPLADAPCLEALGTSLEEWGAGSGYLTAPPARGGGVALRYPTARRGEWIVVQWDGRTAPTLQRVDSAGAKLRSFGPGCTTADAAALARPAPPPDAPTLDDRALDSVLAEARARSARGVVVYAWSPHMPLSVDGWSEVEAASRELGFLAVPALIDQAERGFAEREAERVGIPREGLRAITSVELIMRDLQVHAPAILVLAGDRTSPVLPGYRNAEGYVRYLESFLGSGP